MEKKATNLECTRPRVKSRGWGEVCVRLNGSLWALIHELSLVSTRLGNLHCIPFNNLKVFDRLRERKVNEIEENRRTLPFIFPLLHNLLGGHESAPTCDRGLTQSPGSAHLREEALWPAGGFTDFLQTPLQGLSTPDPWGHCCLQLSTQLRM